MSGLPTGMVTFLFTDIEGSTRLWEQHPEAMRVALARHDSLLAERIQQHGGHVVKSRGEGDSVFAVFARAGDALVAACSLQRALLAESWPEVEGEPADGPPAFNPRADRPRLPLRARIALHTDTAELRDGDYYGLGVIRCARLRAVGHGGQVLLSQATSDRVQERLPPGVSLRDLGTYSLRDLQQPERIFQLLHPSLPDAFPPPRVLIALVRDPAGLEIREHGVAEEAVRLSIRLLGGFDLHRGGERLPRLPAPITEPLMAFLALHPNQEFSLEALAGRFWPGADTKAAHGRLRKALVGIGRLLEPCPEQRGKVLMTTPSGVRFLPPPGCDVDVWEFERLAAEGLEPPLPAEGRIPLLEAAVRGYTGVLLPASDAEWCVKVRARLQRRHAECVRGLVAAHKACKQYARVVKWAEVGLDLDPYDEVCHREVMFARWQQGDRSGALRQYEECRRCLAEGLSLEPSAETVALYQRLRDTPSAAAAAAALAFPELMGPLKGRERELGRLWSAWQAAGRGASQLAFLSGEPGIGKSRLGQELLQRVEDAGGLAVYGQGYHLEGQLLYGPVIDAARAALTLACRCSLAPGSPTVVAKVARLVPELQEHFPDLPPVAASEEGELLDSVCRFFLDLARQRPLCLFMDDLQWADDATLRLLGRLWRQSAGTPLLLVGAFRELEAQENELLESWRREVEVRQPEARLSLPRLSEAAVTELLQDLAGRSAALLPAGLASRLHQGTGGNPFFFLMTLRSMFEAGQLRLDSEGGWRPGEKLFESGGGALSERLAVPPTVREVILARLGRLVGADRRLLEAAAALGPSFGYGLLCQVVGQELEEVLPGVERLLEARLLREAEANELAFDHEQIREVVYEEISLPRRQALHLRAGRALEAQLGERAGARAAELAGHFLKAPQPQCAEPAIRYLFEAGNTARRLLAYGEAARHLQTALALLEHMPEGTARRELRGRIVHALARACGSQGDTQRGEELLEEHIAWCRREGHPAEEARACYYLAAYLWVGYEGPLDLKRIETLYQRSLDLCVRHHLDDWIVKPRLDLTLLHLTWLSNPPALEQLARELNDSLDRLDRNDAREALTLLFGVRARQRRWEEMQAAFTRSLPLGGPDPLVFHLGLGWLERQLAQAGQRERFVALCRGWQAELQAAGIRGLPERWYLEPAEPGPKPPRLLLEASFAREQWPRELTWVDPLGIGVPTWQRGKGLTLAPPRGPDLWPHANVSAPRLMLAVEGDFVGETRVQLGEEADVSAGLLLWASERDFVRLDRRCSRSHGDGVYLEICTNYRYSHVGQGGFPHRAVWLRLERRGAQIRGLCSADGEQWWTCGTGAFPVGCPAQVGLYCITLGTGGAAAFERFTVWSGAGERLAIGD